MRKTNRGFTLIEAMVVVVIIAIMASIGIPSYRQYMMRAQRADGTGALLRMASAQEKFYLQNNRYAGETFPELYTGCGGCQRVPAWLRPQQVVCRGR